MKKITTITFLMLLAACHQVKDSPANVGAQNACSYVKENLSPQQDIAKIEVVNEDSLLSDIGMTFAENQLIRLNTDYLEEKISKADYLSILDSISNDATDVSRSWTYGDVVNDSLRRLSKYEGMWRKVYTVQVSMQSGTSNEYRILMEQDGTTPRMSEHEFSKVVNEFSRKVLSAYRTASRY